ncbi:MAG TPA: outer membrane beta-barrel protein [Isosphaeraceae bacterium]|jgi:hypothetical protein|nr:outer membrane beta-barrel protein [Isosphaeraceae bacterium]
MRSIPRPGWPALALLAALIAGGGGMTRAQDVAPRPDDAPAARPARPRLLSRLRARFNPTPATSPDVRQVRANAADLSQDTPPPPPQPPPTQPAQVPPAQPALPPGVEPGEGTLSTTTDLSLPRAEREEPTTAEAEADAAKSEEAAPKDPTKLLMNAFNRADAPVKVYGWLQNSFTGNANGTPRSRANFGVTPNSLANSWMGNQYYLIVEKPLDAAKPDEVQLGFRVDNLFGNDWQFNHMHGLFDTSYSLNHFAGYDPAQIYGDLHLPILTRGGLDIRGGRFYTLAGYEVVPATGRPLLSVPYMFNYGQPFTHLGMYTTLHLTERINVYNGTINGYDRWFNTHYKWGYIGGVAWSSKTQVAGTPKATVTIITVQGQDQFPNFLPANTLVVPTGATTPPYLAGRANIGYGGNWRMLFTTVVTYKWNEKLTQVIETDQSRESNIPGIGPGGTAQNAAWYSFGNWFLYSLCKDKDGADKLTGVWRSEVFRDNNGVRTGFATTYSEMTLGMIWKPRPYIWIRPEARYDWARSGHPYNDGTRNSQLTLAIDAILLF